MRDIDFLILGVRGLRINLNRLCYYNNTLGSKNNKWKRLRVTGNPDRSANKARNNFFTHDFHAFFKCIFLKSILFGKKKDGKRRRSFSYKTLNQPYLTLIYINIIKNIMQRAFIIGYYDTSMSITTRDEQKWIFEVVPFVSLINVYICKECRTGHSHCSEY